MAPSRSLFLALLGAAATSVANAQENCDPGVDMLPENVNITNAVFKTNQVVDLVDSGEFEVTIEYAPEQVLPYGVRSSVYMYLTGLNGQVWNSLPNNDKEDCALEFEFDGDHDSVLTFPKHCFTNIPDPDPLVEIFNTEIEYFYCAGTNQDCDRVDADTLGFNGLDRNSLRDDALCTKLVYNLEITVTLGDLDQLVQFVLSYIRDPVNPVDAFVDYQGLPVTLQDPVAWAICDKNDLDAAYDYPACFSRMQPNPELRVLPLSTSLQENTFSLVFGMGPTDQVLVDNQHPLTIDVQDSRVYLFHALYTSNDFSSCTGPYCTDVTSQVDFQVGEFNAEAAVAENHHVILSGKMPQFVDGDAPTDMQCDNAFCTLVWVVNFLAKDDDAGAGDDDGPLIGVRRLKATIPFLAGRKLEESATQSKVTKVMVDDHWYAAEQDQSQQGQEAVGENHKTIGTAGIAGITVASAALLFVAMHKVRTRRQRRASQNADKVPVNAV